MITFSDKCREIRFKILDVFEQGGRGHVPSAFSLVEILVALYYKAFDINPLNINENDRDRILLSKGHGCLALYAILEDLGFIDSSEFEKFCKVGGILGGHPVRQKIPGVEVSSGSLGHGLSLAVGKSIYLQRKLINRKTIVVMGDGECDEGTVWEAALSASKNKLNNLVVIIDYNKVQSYGAVSEVCPLEPFSHKWKSFGFNTFELNFDSDLNKFLELVKSAQKKPLAIICHTIKGKGNSILESDPSWHHRNKISKKEIQQLREAMK